MEGRRLKRPVVYTIYTVAFIFVLSVLYIMSINSKESFKTEELPLTYVSKIIFNDTLSVISETTLESKFIKPYTTDKVTIKKNFYDSKDESKDQENALIYYENTYMQSTGIFYESEEEFDIVATFKGTVTAVKEDELLGNIIQITHDNGLVSLYENISDIKVSVNDTVESGTVIAKSGTSNLFKDTTNGLYYELMNDGVNINPLLSYDKTIAEIKG
jgi:stage II sporulation protein Q